MTEKLYRMVNTNLVDDDGSVYYLIKKDEDDVCQVFGKHTAKAIVDELNNLHDENEQLKSKLSKEFPIQDYHSGIHLYCREMTKEELEEQNEQLKLKTSIIKMQKE